MVTFRLAKHAFLPPRPSEYSTCRSGSADFGCSSCIDELEWYFVKFTSRRANSRMSMPKRRGFRNFTWQYGSQAFEYHQQMFSKSLRIDIIVFLTKVAAFRPEVLFVRH